MHDSHVSRYISMSHYNTHLYDLTTYIGAKLYGKTTHGQVKKKIHSEKFENVREMLTKKSPRIGTH